MARLSCSAWAIWAPVQRCRRNRAIQATSSGAVAAGLWCGRHYWFCNPATPSAGEGVPLRATFIVDPQGVIRWASVNDLSVGRNVDEVLRVLDALQTGELCPCNWQAGEPTLQVA